MKVRHSLAAVSLAAAVAVGFGGTGAEATVPLKNAVIDGSVNGFLQTDFVEVGARANGTFGSDTVVPAGTWHTNDAGHPNKLGFRADRGRDGWGVGIDDGDFFITGAPLEVFGLVVDGTRYWNADWRTGITGSFVSSSTTADPSITWDSSADSGGVALSQTYSIPTDGSLYLDIDVTLTNNNGSSAEVYYVRSVDADNCRTRTEAVCDTDGDGVADNPGGLSWHSYRTWNKIESQRLDGDLVTMATASQTDGSVVGVMTTDTESVAYTAAVDWTCNIPVEASTLYQQTRTYTKDAPWTDLSGCPWFNQKGAEGFGDDVIGVIVHRTIGAGASATFTVRYVLSYNSTPSSPLAVTAASPTAISSTTPVPSIDHTTDLSLDPSDWITVPTCGVYSPSDTTFIAPLTGAQAPGTYITHCSGGATYEYYPVTYIDGTVTVEGPVLPVTGGGSSNTAWLAAAFLLVGIGLLSFERRRIARR